MVPIKLELPEGFLEEEVRCEYTVSRQMKEVWAIELDLLAQTERVCKKYGLTYFALGGTLLGAIRHKGFIPWDDDIDLLMPRKDYDKFLEVSAAEFQEPYFLSTPVSEHRFWRTHAQLRNSMTTGAIKIDEPRNNNKGIFIDIFPLDEVPGEFTEREVHRKKIKSLQKLVKSDMDLEVYRTKDNALKFLLRKTAAKLMVKDATYAQTFRKLNQTCAMYTGSGSGKVGHTTLKYLEAAVWDAQSYAQAVAVPFEFTTISVPVQYDTVLEKRFGADYMEIPKNPPSSYHGAVFFDTEHSYKTYYNKEEKK